jgi:hypothetical protein
MNEAETLLGRQTPARTIGHFGNEGPAPSASKNYRGRSLSRVKVAHSFNSHFDSVLTSAAQIAKILVSVVYSFGDSHA